MKHKGLTIALAALLLVPALALAQEEAAEPEFVLWLNFMKAKPGQGDALVGLLMEEDAKHFDPLIDSGAAVEWGIALPIVHDGDMPYSHLEWVTFANWAGADTFMKNFMEMQGSRSEEERKAAQERYEAAVVPGSHADTILRVIHLGQGSGGRPGYIHAGFYKARPGKSGPAKEFYAELAVPVYDQLVADGAILNYGLDVPTVHRDEPWTHVGWYASENLASRDAVSKAFNAADAARSEEENKELMQRWADIFEPEAHSDQIFLVVHYKSAGGAGGDSE